ncbi:MAG: alpha/beta fold hydrolase [Methanobacterium sp.]|nr:alpha/beta fold hydrolase [Methanobacterium sp.]
MLKPEYFTINDFKFESGELIPELKLEYATQGIKKLDSDGNITNAFIYLHGWSGDYSSVENLSSVIGPGKIIDTNHYYVISPTALGAPGSSSPSTSSQGTMFPRYNIKDMVKAHYQLITRGLGIKHLKGIMGTSMGGFQALNWAIEYPDVMDFLILNGTSHRISNRMYGVYDLMNQIILDDSGYENGHYSDNPVKVMEKLANLSFLWSLSPENYEVCFQSRSEFSQGVEERMMDAQGWDANDLVWRNHALLGHDLGDKISKISVPSLVIAINQDQIVDFNFCVLPMYEALENSQLFRYDSIWGHYGCVRDIQKSEGAIKKFMQLI